MTEYTSHRCDHCDEYRHRIDSCDSCRDELAEAIAQARQQALDAAIAAVERLPYRGGGHMDSVWSDAVGSIESWHECVTGSGLGRAAVLAALRELRDGAG